MRLIDADELLMLNSWDFYDEFGNKNSQCKAVENTPTVDAVPVVRCKDCKWWADIDGWSKSVGIGACCYNGKVMRLGFLTTENWYCADGARMEGDE